MGRVSLWVALITVGWAFCAGDVAAQNVSEQYLLAAANQERAAIGLPTLRADDRLAVAARLHAALMAEHGTISHRFAGEDELAKRAGDSGAHFSTVSENVAEASNSAKIHEMWMNSKGHRENLLDARVDSVGIAVVQRGGQLYAVEDFARTVAQLTLAQQETQVEGLVAGAGLAVDGNKTDARQTCTLSSGYVGGRQPSFVMRYTVSSLDRLPEELSSQLATGKYNEAVVGACVTGKPTPFTSYSVAVMLFR